MSQPRTAGQSCAEATVGPQVRDPDVEAGEHAVGRLSLLGGLSLAHSGLLDLESLQIEQSDSRALIRGQAMSTFAQLWPRSAHHSAGASPVGQEPEASSPGSLRLTPVQPIVGCPAAVYLMAAPGTSATRAEMMLLTATRVMSVDLASENRPEQNSRTWRRRMSILSFWNRCCRIQQPSSSP